MQETLGREAIAEDDVQSRGAWAWRWAVKPTMEDVEDVGHVRLDGFWGADTPFVTVEQGHKELFWNFCTKKKNISFGLYRKSPSSPVANGASSPPHRSSSTGIRSGKASSAENLMGAGSGIIRTIGSALNMGSNNNDVGSPRSSKSSLLEVDVTHVSNTAPSSAGSGPGSAGVGQPNSLRKNSSIAVGSTNAPSLPAPVDGKSTVDPELIEIVPITHYDSSKFTIKGSYYIEEPGTFVLLFDNTFSVNTSKKLFFFVALRDVETVEPPRARKAYEGWILKKGNRKMQGYAKRWMKIDSDGNLQYFRQPGGESRGFFQLSKTAVRLDHDHLLIDIDSGESLMHLKAIGPQDFQMWVGALQSHAEAKTGNLETEEDRIAAANGGGGGGAYGALLSGGGDAIMSSQGFASADNSTTPTGRELNPSDTMTTPTEGSSGANGAFGTNVGHVIGSEMDVEALQRRVEHLAVSLTKELSKMKDFIDTSRSRLDNKVQGKDVNLVLGSISDIATGLQTNSMTLQRGLQSYANSVRLSRDRQSLSLRQAELALRSSMADNNRVRRKFGLDPVSIQSFLPYQTPASASLPSSVRGAGARFGTGNSSMREDVFYDAEEPLGGVYRSEDDDDDDDDDSVTSEYLLDHEDGTYGREAGEEDLGDGVYDDDEDDYDDPLVAAPEVLAETAPVNGAGVHVAAPQPSVPEKARVSETEGKVAAKVSEPESNVTPADASAATKGDVKTEAVAPVVKPKVAVVRRKALPAPTVSMENISILSILRNNVGKDLSTVAMPIALNEPLNLLQKLAEELEYFELLEAASGKEDPVDRMIAMAGYASTVNRAGRKPFNPLLGETYECIREDKGFRLISEKVSHHPPIMACYADSPNYKFFQDNQVKTKFWGKSMELIPSGSVHVVLPKVNDEYVWTKGYTCQLVFKESGYFTSAKNEVAGTVFTPGGEEVSWLIGKWDDSLNRYNKATPNNLEVIWRARPCPPNHAQMYGFTSFSVELNELTEDIKPLLPNTDTRFRTDQRMYEEGRAEEAEAEKLRLEQKQRDYRKKLEGEGKKWTPQWFELVPGEAEDGDGATGGNGVWRYKGGYFEKRGAFEKVIDLW
ncbi:hypothetical protein HK101_008225 [Irineochytrium annulatum]|nr:hypothetical protein HK101_008225 [Irineochytrium annulatum]